MLTNISDKTKSTIIRKACPYCKKIAIFKSSEMLGAEKAITLQCGHTYVESIVQADGSWRTKALSGKEPFPYQYDTLDFIEESNFRTGIFHEQGVGKTICSLLPIVKHNLFPFVVVCKSSLKAQWWKEILDWTSQPAQIIAASSDKPFPELFKAFVISYDLLRSRNPFENIPIKLVILDECQQIKNSQAKRTQGIRNLVRGQVAKPRIFNPRLSKRPRIEMIAKDLMSYHSISPRFKLSFEDIGPKRVGLCECKSIDGIIRGQITIDVNHAENDNEKDVIETILHEIAHAITPGAGHRPIWRDTSTAIGGDDGSVFHSCNGSIEPAQAFYSEPFVLALSGTPIKNHAGEYFPILNILHPEIFPSQAQYEIDFCNSYTSGYGYKIDGLSRFGESKFKNLTKDWIIRYDREAVLPDLPKIFRKNFFVELGDEVAQAYKKAYIDFQEAYLEGSSDFGEQGNILAKLNRMRHLTGIAKILPISEFVQEFLEDNERKITLFVHHKDVGLGLFNHISKICSELKIDAPLQLTSENAGSDVGARIDEEWKTDPRKRVMIASTLSAGEGKNWQMCSDAILVERQWNPANEEQAEGRFPRPGISKEVESISITYALALGTPDEYLAEIVERKREICRKTMGNESVAWDQTSVIREMADLLFSKGGKRWNL